MLSIRRQHFEFRFRLFGFSKFARSEALSAAHRFTNNRAYSPKEQFGDVCSWSFCCICCCGCCNVDCWVSCVESMFDGDRNSECVCWWGCCGCWNWKCCWVANRSMWSVPVSMLWNCWLLLLLIRCAVWIFGLAAASRLLRDCFGGWSQLSNILIDVDGSSNRNNPFGMQLPEKCCAVWFTGDSDGCDWLCWLFWDCFATASKIVAIYNIRGQTGLINRWFDFQTIIGLSRFVGRALFFVRRMRAIQTVFVLFNTHRHTHRKNAWPLFLLVIVLSPIASLHGLPYWVVPFLSLNLNVLNAYQSRLLRQFSTRNA